jgi:hypothetical protein
VSYCPWTQKWSEDAEPTPALSTTVPTLQEPPTTTYPDHPAAPEFSPRGLGSSAERFRRRRSAEWMDP